MIIGYARVSTEEQNLDLQIEALKKAGCEDIYQEKISSMAGTRPEYLRMLDKLRKDDIVVVYSLSRLGRTLKHLIEQIEDFRVRGIHFKSLTEGIDTTTATGRLTFNVIASIVQFERELLIERTNAGLAAARARGRKGGRARKLLPGTIKQLKADYAARKLTIDELCIRYKIARATLYKYVND